MLRRHLLFLPLAAAGPGLVHPLRVLAREPVVACVAGRAPTIRAAARLSRRGGSGVVVPSRMGGHWEAVRDITLGLNIPGYRACA